MAVLVTQSSQVIKIANGTSGAVTNADLIIQAVVLEHSAAASAILTDAAGSEFFRIRTVANDLADMAVFGKDGIRVKGLAIPTTGKTSMANIFVYLK